MFKWALEGANKQWDNSLNVATGGECLNGHWKKQINHEVIDWKLLEEDSV